MKLNTLAKGLLVLGLLGVNLIMSACMLGQALGPTVTSTPAPTLTFPPTETSQPSATPAPTLTPTSTYTPSPRPTDTATPQPTFRPSPTSVVETGLDPITAANARGLTNLAIMRFDSPSDGPAQAAFIPDGSHVVVITSNVRKQEPVSQVQLRNAQTGAVVNQFEISASARKAWITADGLNVMAYDPGASVLRVYDVFSGAVVAEQSLGVRYTSPTSPGLWWSASGWLAALQVGDSSVKLWDVRQAVSLSTVDSAAPIRTAGANPRMGFSADDRLFVIALDNGYAAYDVQTGKLAANFDTQGLEPNPNYIAEGIALSPDNRLFALTGSSFNDEAVVQVWQVQTGKPAFVSSRSGGGGAVIEDLAFSPDGKWLAWAAGSGNVQAVQVELFDTATGKQRATLPGFAAITFSPDGSLLADAREDGTLVVWNLAGNAQVATLTGHGQQDVKKLRFSSDGRRLLSLGQEAVRLWGVPAAGAAVARTGLNVVEKSTYANVFTAVVPAVWLAQGATPPRYELALSSDLATLTSCPYTGNHTLYLKQLNITAIVTDLEKKQVVAQQTFYGKYTNLTCPATQSFTGVTKDAVVSMLDSAEFEAWLKTVFAPLGFTP
jgi:WD40 repeat protein